MTIIIRKISRQGGDDSIPQRIAEYLDDAENILWYDEMRSDEPINKFLYEFHCIDDDKHVRVVAWGKIHDLIAGLQRAYKAI